MYIQAQKPASQICIWDVLRKGDVCSCTAAGCTHIQTPNMLTNSCPTCVPTRRVAKVLTMKMRASASRTFIFDRLGTGGWKSLPSHLHGDGHHIPYHNHGHMRAWHMAACHSLPAAQRPSQFRRPVGTGSDTQPTGNCGRCVRCGKRLTLAPGQRRLRAFSAAHLHSKERRKVPTCATGSASCWWQQEDAVKVAAWLLCHFCTKVWELVARCQEHEQIKQFGGMCGWCRGNRPPHRVR